MPFNNTNNDVLFMLFSPRINASVSSSFDQMSPSCTVTQQAMYCIDRCLGGHCRQMGGPACCYMLHESMMGFKTKVVVQTLTMSRCLSLCAVLSDMTDGILILFWRFVLLASCYIMCFTIKSPHVLHFDQIRRHIISLQSPSMRVKRTALLDVIYFLAIYHACQNREKSVRANIH